MIQAEEISRSIAELTTNLYLGALDSNGYQERAEIVVREATAILQSGESFFSVKIAGRQFIFPIIRFGASVTSLSLFDYKELSVFAIYCQLYDKVKRFLDLGSNIGTHSIFFAAMGAAVRSWDPDPSVSTIQHDIFKNHGLSCQVVEAAAGVTRDRVMFVHLDDNQTGSHVVGKKSAPYGAMTHFEVKVEDCRPDINWADLVKMDVEGSESEILCQTPYETLSHSLIVCEVTNQNSAQDMYEYLSSAPVSMYSQRSGWGRPASAHDLPSHHSHGSLLVVGHECRLQPHLEGNATELLRSH